MCSQSCDFKEYMAGKHSLNYQCVETLKMISNKKFNNARTQAALLDLVGQ